MSKLNYKKLYGRNFHSYEEFALPILPGKHLIIGENGIGKSTLFESLIWTQHKRSERGNDPSRDYKGNCMTSEVLEIDGDVWKIERYWKDKIHKNSIKIYKNGEEESNRKKLSTEADIADIIGISYDVFVSSIVVLQGIPINFTQYTPTLRKTLVEEMVGFSVWTTYKTKFAGSLKEHNLDKNTKDINYNQHKAQMIELNSKVETLKRVESDVTLDFGKEVMEVKKKIQGIQEDLKGMEDNKLKQFGNKTYGDIHASMTQLRDSLSTMQTRARNLNTVINEKICPQCNQNYPEARITQAIDEANSLTSKLTKVEEMHGNTENDLRNCRELDAKITKCTTENQLLQGQLETIGDRMTNKASDSSLAKFQEELNNLLVTVNALAQETREVDKRISNVQYLDQLVLPSSKFRTDVLSKYMTYINEIIDSITGLIFENLEFKLCISDNDKGIDLDIKRNNKKIKYKSLSGGERRRLDIIVILAFQRFLIESAGVSSNLLVFDEIFDGLDIHGVESILNCMDTLFPESSSIYVITHQNAIKSAFSSVIKLVKENEISRIEGFGHV